MMKITSKTTRAEMAAWIKTQDAQIAALKVTRDQLRKKVEVWQARGFQTFCRDILFDVLFGGLASFFAGVVIGAIIW